MASIPPRSNTSSPQPPPLSHGRGGAGNIGYTTNEVNPNALETPHITSEIYTTGRGGTGNMAKNTDAEETRRAQDVVGLPRDSMSSTHIGRGGEGNVVTRASEEVARAKRENAKSHPVATNEVNKGNEGGFAEKAKRWLLQKVGKS